MDQINALIEAFEYPQAKECCEKLLATDPGCFEALSTLASLQLELGDPSGSLATLHKCNSLCKEGSWEICMSLGQLTQGQESANWFNKGIALLRNSSIDKLALSTALISLAEVYMTDLCEEPEAESNCIKLVQEALELAPSNPEALVTATSLALCRGLSLDECKEPLEKFLQITSNEETSTFDSRLNAVRLALELGMNQEALTLLEGLAKEDDEEIDVFYLMALAHQALGEVGKAQEALAEAEGLLEAEGAQDPEMAEAISTLRAELGEGEWEVEESESESEAEAMEM
jgi:tetratricopeptide (TPR) repeat protein